MDVLLDHRPIAAPTEALCQPEIKLLVTIGTFADESMPNAPAEISSCPSDEGTLAS
jgi:hypothetical protein